jgi:hypothetical protein
MERKDYLSLQSKYSCLADYQERYRKELLDFINDAFEKHGDEFEYKCDTHATWQEKNEDEEAEFDAMNDLPQCVTIWVDDDGGHEVYPTVIRQYVNSTTGSKHIEADGWDWYDTDWVECQEIHPSLEELQSVANFINAVLEQEQKLCPYEVIGLEQQVRKMYDKYMEEHGHKPQYLKCVVRWKDDGDEGLDNIALDKSADDEDCVFSVSGILSLQDLVRYNEEDFEIVELLEMWSKEG